MPTTLNYSGSSLRDAVKLILQGNSNLTALLTGGVFDASDLPQNGMDIEHLPRGVDKVTVLPFAVIRFSSTPRFGPFSVHAGRGDIEIYVYQHRGYDVIDPAVALIKGLLLDAHILVSDFDLAHVYWQFEGADTTDEALGNLPTRFVRFTRTIV